MNSVADAYDIIDPLDVDDIAQAALSPAANDLACATLDSRVRAGPPSLWNLPVTLKFSYVRKALAYRILMRVKGESWVKKITDKYEAASSRHKSENPSAQFASGFEIQDTQQIDQTKPASPAKPEEDSAAPVEVPQLNLISSSDQEVKVTTTSCSDAEAEDPQRDPNSKNARRDNFNRLVFMSKSIPLVSEDALLGAKKRTPRSLQQGGEATAVLRHIDPTIITKREVPYTNQSKRLEDKLVSIEKDFHQQRRANDDQRRHFSFTEEIKPLHLKKKSTSRSRKTGKFSKCLNFQI